MEFIDRSDEMRRLDRALDRSGSFSVIWGRRRVGKSRLLLEWCRRHDGLYTVADQSAPPVQRRYLASAVAERFSGFADIEYPTWLALFARLSAEADRTGWSGAFVVDELPYLVAMDRGLPSEFQNWLDQPGRRLRVVVSGSSQSMMHRAVLDAGAPLFGRAVEAFALRPLRAGYLADVFEFNRFSDLVRLYALWGGMPRYWELAVPFGRDLDAAVDSLVLDPSGPLHHEPERLLREEIPPATALRPLLDVIGSGSHRLSEIAGGLGRATTSLARPSQPSRKWVSCVVKSRSAATQPRASAAFTALTTRSSASGFVWSHRTGRLFPDLRLNRAFATGTGTSANWKAAHGRNCVAQLCRGFTVSTIPLAASVRSRPRSDSGTALPRSGTWLHVQLMDAASSSEKQGGPQIPRAQRDCLRDSPTPRCQRSRAATSYPCSSSRKLTSCRNAPSADTCWTPSLCLLPCDDSVDGTATPALGHTLMFGAGRRESLTIISRVNLGRASETLICRRVVRPYPQNGRKQVPRSKGHWAGFDRLGATSTGWSPRFGGCWSERGTDIQLHRLEVRP